MSEFGSELRRLRVAAGVSLRALARGKPFSWQHVSALECGRRFPSPAVARALDDALLARGALVRLLVAAPPEPLAAADVDGIAAGIADLIRADTARGGELVLPAALDLLHGYRARLAVTVRPSRDMRAQVAELGQVSAWLAHDAADDVLAERLLTDALALSSLAGAPVRWLVVDQLSMLAQWRGWVGDAVDWAELGLTLGPSGVVAGMFEVRRARSLADLGDAAGSDLALSRARTLVGAGPGPDDPAWCWWLHQAELDLHAASAASMLGRHDAAVALASGSVGALPAGQTRDEAAFAVRLGWMCARARDWPGVVDAAGLVRSVPTARVAGMVADTRRIAVAGRAPSSVLDALDVLRTC